MQIVIDVPDEELYKIEHDRVITDEQRAMLVCAITDGTPLPKGHGELIDKDVVLDMMNHGILEEYITTMGGVIPANKWVD